MNFVNLGINSDDYVNLDNVSLVKFEDEKIIINFAHFVEVRGKRVPEYIYISTDEDYTKEVEVMLGVAGFIKVQDNIMINPKMITNIKVHKGKFILNFNYAKDTKKYQSNENIFTSNSIYIDMGSEYEEAIKAMLSR